MNINDPYGTMGGTAPRRTRGDVLASIKEARAAFREAKERGNQEEISDCLQVLQEYKAEHQRITRSQP